MSRKTLIFGNGLGKSLDIDFFDLDRAIGKVWDDAAALEDEQKHLITQCLPTDAYSDRPTSEDDLNILQRVLAACDFLNGVGQGDIHWLSDEGRRFPEAIRRFVFKVAHEFHVNAPELPEDFVMSLMQFLWETRSHIGTLNYDNLLYQPLIEGGVLAGYSGALVDGFYKAGFAGENLLRRFGNDFGYYLHLHGSPLFVDRDDAIIKLRQVELRADDDRLSSHIVLTHVEHKRSVIAASNLLQTYWKYLFDALEESHEVLLFGYSGLDEHLNDTIKDAFPNGKIRIIEWQGAGEYSERIEWWKGIYGNKIILVQLNNLMEFRDWRCAPENV